MAGLIPVTSGAVVLEYVNVTVDTNSMDEVEPVISTKNRAFVKYSITN